MLSILFFQNIVNSTIHIVIEWLCGAEQFGYALYEVGGGDELVIDVLH